MRGNPRRAANAGDGDRSPAPPGIIGARRLAGIRRTGPIGRRDATPSQNALANTGGMERPPLSIEVKTKDQNELTSLLSGGVQQVRVVLRALTLPQLAKGVSAARISSVVALAPRAIRKVGHRYQTGGLEPALCDKQRAGISHSLRPIDPPLSSIACHLAMQYPETKTIHLVMGNLNIDRRKSLTDVFGVEVGHEIWDRFTVHYTPTHGSWLNQAEIEIGIFLARGRDLANICLGGWELLACRGSGLLFTARASGLGSRVTLVLSSIWYSSGHRRLRAACRCRPQPSRSAYRRHPRRNSPHTPGSDR
jgi:hypothetical protein